VNDRALGGSSTGLAERDAPDRTVVRGAEEHRAVADHVHLVDVRVDEYVIARP